MPGRTGFLGWEGSLMTIEELKGKLVSAPSRDAVLSLLEEALFPLFQAERARVFPLRSVPADALAQFEQNPVIRLFLREESALHEAQVIDNETWRRHCPRADHGHVLMGPIVVDGELWGAAAVTRAVGGATIFTAADLRVMNRLCLHVSTRLAQLGNPKDGHTWPELSPREGDVANLARRGLRNREIAERLTLSEHTVKQNLKAVFRKLGLRSRTELATLTRER